MKHQSPSTSILIGMCLLVCGGSAASDYDPSVLPATVKVLTRDVTVRDEGRIAAKLHAPHRGRVGRLGPTGC